MLLTNRSFQLCSLGAAIYLLSSPRTWLTVMGLAVAVAQFASSAHDLTLRWRGGDPLFEIRRHRTRRNVPSWFVVDLGPGGTTWDDLLGAVAYAAQAANRPAEKSASGESV